jgi:hypothetical protein
MTEMEQLMQMARENIFSQFLQTDEEKDAMEIILIIGMLMA